MGRGTSYNGIVAAIESSERLTRAQGCSLLAYAQKQEKQLEKAEQRITALEKALHNEQISHEQDVVWLQSLITKWNAMIDMLHTFLGYKLYDIDIPVAEQYRQALEEKFHTSIVQEGESLP